MKKFIVAAILCMATVTGFAQNKFGNINTEELFNAMPEKAQIEKEMQDLSQKYETELSKMSEEYQAKVSEYLAQHDSLPANIQEAREQEIGQLQQRIQNFRQMAMQDLQTKQQEKTAPVFDKIQKAITAVGERDGFTYIFDTTQAGVLYFSPTQCVDAMPLVKTQLGLK